MSKTFTLEDLENMWIDKVEGPSIDEKNGEKYLHAETLSHMKKHILLQYVELQLYYIALFPFYPL